MDIQIFLDMGLEKREAEVYLSLLEMGPSLASSIAKKTNIDRSVVYKKLGSLINRGFASYHIRENRRYFQATDPQELLELAKEREHKLEELLPNLIAMQKPQAEETRVEIFRGRDGAKAMLNDILRHSAETGGTYYGIGYTAEMPDFVGAWYDTYTRKRVENKLHRKMLVSYKKVGMYALKQPLTEVRLLPRDLEFPSSIIIYGRKSAIYYPQEKDFTGIIIDSKGITDSNRAFFEALWRKSREI